jgi:lipopolysaccharide biosynthesis regulator YciM
MKNPRMHTWPLTLKPLFYYASMILAAWLALSPLGLTQAPGKSVIKAFDVRMQGHTGEAKSILVEVLEGDTSNAFAHFEMARLLTAANPFNTDSILYHCDKAVLHDPENAHFVFFRAKSAMLAAYIAMHKDDQELIRRMTAEACAGFHKALELDPSCKEAYLYLIDIYATAPEEYGGAIERAKELWEELKAADALAYARASLYFGEEDQKESTLWTSYIAEHGASAEARELLFKAYLMEDAIDSAEVIYQQLVEIDPQNTRLILDLARAHMLRVMQGKGNLDEDPDQAKSYLLQYVEGDTRHPACVLAWCYGQLGRIEMFRKNKEAADGYMEKAGALCPGFSRAFAVPAIDPPLDNLAYSFVSFFRPF